MHKIATINTRIAPNITTDTTAAQNQPSQYQENWEKTIGRPPLPPSSTANMLNMLVSTMPSGAAEIRLQQAAQPTPNQVSNEPTRQRSLTSTDILKNELEAKFKILQEIVVENKDYWKPEAKIRKYPKIIDQLNEYLAEPKNSNVETLAASWEHIVKLAEDRSSPSAEVRALCSAITQGTIKDLRGIQEKIEAKIEEQQPKSPKMK